MATTRGSNNFVRRRQQTHDQALPRRPFLQIVVLFASDQRVLAYAKQVQAEFMSAGVDVWLQTELTDRQAKDFSASMGHRWIKPEHLVTVINCTRADSLIVLGDRNLKNESCQTRRQGKLVEEPVSKSVRTLLHDWAELTGLKHLKRGFEENNGNVSETQLLDFIKDLTGQCGHARERLDRLRESVSELNQWKAHNSQFLSEDSSAFSGDLFSDADQSMLTKLTRSQTLAVKLHKELYNSLKHVQSLHGISANSSFSAATTNHHHSAAGRHHQNTSIFGINDPGLSLDLGVGQIITAVSAYAPEPPKLISSSSAGFVNANTRERVIDLLILLLQEADEYGDQLGSVAGDASLWSAYRAAVDDGDWVEHSGDNDNGPDGQYASAVAKLNLSEDSPSQMTPEEETITSMGFGLDKARAMLKATNNNVEVALNNLLEGIPVPSLEAEDEWSMTGAAGKRQRKKKQEKARQVEQERARQAAAEQQQAMKQNAEYERSRNQQRSTTSKPHGSRNNSNSATSFQPQHQRGKAATTKAPAVAAVPTPAARSPVPSISSSSEQKRQTPSASVTATVKTPSPSSMLVKPAAAPTTATTSTRPSRLPAHVAAGHVPNPNPVSPPLVETMEQQQHRHFGSQLAQPATIAAPVPHTPHAGVSLSAGQPPMGANLHREVVPPVGSGRLASRDGSPATVLHDSVNVPSVAISPPPQPSAAGLGGGLSELAGGQYHGMGQQLQGPNVSAVIGHRPSSVSAIGPPHQGGAPSSAASSLAGSHELFQPQSLDRSTSAPLSPKYATNFNPVEDQGGLLSPTMLNRGSSSTWGGGSMAMPSTGQSLGLGTSPWGAAVPPLGDGGQTPPARMGASAFGFDLSGDLRAVRSEQKPAQMRNSYPTYPWQSSSAGAGATAGSNVQPSNLNQAFSSSTMDAFGSNGSLSSFGTSPGSGLKASASEFVPTLQPLGRDPVHGNEPVSWEPMSFGSGFGQVVGGGPAPSQMGWSPDMHAQQGPGFQQQQQHPQSTSFQGTGRDQQGYGHHSYPENR